MFNLSNLRKCRMCRNYIASSAPIQAPSETGAVDARDRRKPPSSETGAVDARDKRKPPPSETGAKYARDRPKPPPSKTGAGDDETAPE